MIKPAIVAVGYNRPDNMKRLLDSIGNAAYETNDIPLIISIDESNKSNEVEKVAQEFEWTHGTKEIRRFPERQGLRKHIIQCGDYSLKYGSVIILEDDLLVAEDFYIYTSRAHEKYSGDSRICGVSLYSYGTNVFTHIPFVPMPSISNVFLSDMVVTWGQSWTDKQWTGFKTWYIEHEDKLPAVNSKIPYIISGWTRSWGRYFASYMAEKGKSYIAPYTSRTTCFADVGEHNTAKSVFTFVQVPLMHGCPKAYNFDEYDRLVHYDSFFERVFCKSDIVHGVSGDQICMDINQMKTDTLGKKYVVTGSVLPHKKIASFGLSLRPISLNVINNIPGNQLFMYQMNNGETIIRNQSKKRQEMRLSLRRLQYEYKDASWRLLLYYAPLDFFVRLKDRISKYW